MKGLDEIKERLEAATQGPWRSDIAFMTAGVNDGSNPYWAPAHIEHGKCCWCNSFELIGTTKRNGVNFHVHANLPNDSTIVSPSTLETVVPDCGMKEEDVAFITHSPTDIRRLITRVEKLEQALKWYGDEENYTENIGVHNGPHTSLVQMDCGERAHAELSEDDET